LELRLRVVRFQRSWPRFADDPVAFTKAQFVQLQSGLKIELSRPYVLRGLLTAATLVLSLILLVLLFERHSKNPAVVDDSEDLGVALTIDFRNEQNHDSHLGIGAGENCRIGLQKRAGGG